jgi:hypothetical protein
MLTYVDGQVAETTIIDYRLSFANQGSQSSVFLFSFAANK